MWGSITLCCLVVASEAPRDRRRLEAYNFEEVAKLTASDAGADDWFGSSVAIDGDTIVIGAYLDDDGGYESGSAYVFRTSDGGATYGQVAKLKASDAAVNDRFGISVAIDGAAIVVGAYAPSWAGGSGWGSVYVFRTSDGGATYGQVAKLTAADAAADDLFGYSVAIDGGTIVVGTYRKYYDEGAVYAFRTIDGGATYGQVAKLTAADAAYDDRFGVSVAIDGDTVVVGAYKDDDDGTNSGSVYIFSTSDGGATYGQVTKLTASEYNIGDQFGWSVAIDGNTVVVGASEDDDASDCTNNLCSSGSAYVFRTTDGGATYGKVAKLTASDGAAGDYFGHTVAVYGDTTPSWSGLYS